MVRRPGRMWCAPEKKLPPSQMAPAFPPFISVFKLQSFANTGSFEHQLENLKTVSPPLVTCIQVLASLRSDVYSLGVVLAEAANYAFHDEATRGQPLLQVRLQRMFLFEISESRPIISKAGSGQTFETAERRPFCTATVCADD